MILTNQPLPPFDEDLSISPLLAQPLHVRKSDAFIVLTQWDCEGDDLHCILVERRDIDALIQALEERK